MGLSILRSRLGLLAALTSVLPVLAMALPFSFLDHASAIYPNLFYIVLFFWTLRRPDVYPLILVVLVGVLQDLLYDDWLGLNIFCNVLIYAVLMIYRRFLLGRSFQFTWSLFTVLVILVESLRLILYLNTIGGAPFIETFVLKTTLTILFYPVGISILDWLHRRFA